MPSPSYQGIKATRIAVKGSMFDVRQRGLHAEAIRINPQYAPRFGLVRDRAAIAMTLVTGCHVVEVAGDQAQAFGRLDCGEGPAPRINEARALECVPVRGSEIVEIGQVRIDLDCDPA